MLDRETLAAKSAEVIVLKKPIESDEKSPKAISVVGDVSVLEDKFEPEPQPAEPLLRYIIPVKKPENVKKVKKTWFDEQREENLYPENPTAWNVPLTKTLHKRQYTTERKVNERIVTMNNFVQMVRGPQQP